MSQNPYLWVWDKGSLATRAPGGSHLRTPRPPHKTPGIKRILASSGKFSGHQHLATDSATLWVALKLRAILPCPLSGPALIPHTSEATLRTLRAPPAPCFLFWKTPHSTYRNRLPPYLPTGIGEEARSPVLKKRKILVVSFVVFYTIQHSLFCLLKCSMVKFITNIISQDLWCMCFFSSIITYLILFTYILTLSKSVILSVKVD